ncbi:MAG: flagellar protein FlgN [Cellulosilyticum sp.]|nr:flagellar protein FlgN [Cellulosilyticum sp.]
MAGIIYELIDVLEEQKECYEGLNTLATYTENAVINKNIEFLQEVVKTEEQFIGRINNLEKKRESLMQDICIVTGMKYQDVTVTLMIEKIGPDTEVGQKLTVLRDETKEQLKQLKRQSDLNKQLLADSLELVEFMVNALGATQGYSHVGSYNRPGEDMAMQRQQSIFDKKQ